MNSVGLNIFIAVVGISAGPGFVAGLQSQGISLFLWGIVATSMPLILAIVYVGQLRVPLRPSHPAGLSARARAPRRLPWAWSARSAKSQVPALGYAVTLRHRQYAADYLGHGDRHVVA